MEKWKLNFHKLLKCKDKFLLQKKRGYSPKSTQNKLSRNMPGEIWKKLNRIFFALLNFLLIFFIRMEESCQEKLIFSWDRRQAGFKTLTSPLENCRSVNIQALFKKENLNNNEILQKEKKYFETMENYFDGSKTQRRKAEWKEQISKFQTIFFLSEEESIWLWTSLIVFKATNLDKYHFSKDEKIFLPRSKRKLLFCSLLRLPFKR